MFPHRKPGMKTREAMAKASLRLGMEYEGAPAHVEVKEAEGAVSDLTGHSHAAAMATGDCAILAALSAIEGKVALPDQGIWKGFKRHAALLGVDVVEIKTDLGLIDTEALSQALTEQNPGALCVSSFAGYVAEQPIAEISKLCRENDCLFVEDASGAVGDTKLASSKYADVIVCSAGSPKVLNIVTGGFLSTDIEEVYERAKSIVRACRLNPISCAGLVEELKNAPRRVGALLRFSELLKEEFGGVVHPEKRGVCVGIELKKRDPRKAAMEARAKGLVTDLGKSLLTICPRYERFLKNGLVIELKKLEILEMSEEEVLDIPTMLNGLI